MRARRILRGIGIGLAVIVAVPAIYFMVLVVTTPNVDHLRSEAPTQTSFMRLRGGDSARVEWVDLDGISPYLACAVVKAEDGGFFRHAGFEWGPLRKAFWAYVSGRSRGGGSTITQQLAKNLYLTPDRSMHRKLREALITRRLERSLDKLRILEIYLNVVEWGDGVWGAKQAARFYFGRPPTELSVFEAVVLASLLPAPRVSLDGRNRRRALYAQRRVLRQLRSSRVIDEDQYSEAVMRVDLLAKSLARGRTLRDAIADASTEPIAAPDPVAQVVSQIEPAQALANECGFARELAQRARDQAAGARHANHAVASTRSPP
ncbi:MAG TPA: biosynthetic peptidoglycan transglycosylase [Kofleriaceae bacterium]